MKKVLVAVSLSLLFFSCENSKKQELETTQESPIQLVKKLESTTPVKGEYLSAVDTSSVATYDDFDNIKTILFNEYDSIKALAWRKYDERKRGAFDIYIQKKDSVISLIRAQHYEKYILWLDAREQNDFAARIQIEKSPEFKILQDTEYWYMKYLEVDKEGYEEYQEMDRDLYTEFSLKENIAWNAYRSKK